MKSQPNKKLLILGCSERKRESPESLPALDRYDGPSYRILRRFLREFLWPRDVSIAVLSAKYGLFGVLKAIDHYNTRMDQDTAKSNAQRCSAILQRWADDHTSIHLSLGKDYLPALQPARDSLSTHRYHIEVFEGGIGEKNRRVKNFLSQTPPTKRNPADFEGGSGHLRYFLPDWDDLLDPAFDFEADSFSGVDRTQRGDKHCAVLMSPNRICDGILVSLAQRHLSKGPLRKLRGTEPGSLAPPPLSECFGLSTDQYLFGDCGAFSYANEDAPTISNAQAIALYEAYGFDFGTSVDHIPVLRVTRAGEHRTLTEPERQERVDITRANAEAFIHASARRKVGFKPVGAIQGLTSAQYAQFVRDYHDMGYRYMALGGLVSLPDSQVRSIVQAVSKAAEDLRPRPWIHLFGVFRPNLQETFRNLKLDSFDSATYFRKAWLRSDQNYLSTDGKWYTAIRVPILADGRTRKRLLSATADLAQLEVEERRALDLLCRYDRGEAGLNETLEAVLSYDGHLARSSESPKKLGARYRRTLEERPWRQCQCNFCANHGIHMLIFRGANRNRRRGAHNTMVLYRDITQSAVRKGSRE